MGFAKPSAPPVQTEPPVVSDVVENDSQNALSHQNSRRRGLLATILTEQKNHTASATPPSQRSNTTLG